MIKLKDYNSLPNYLIRKTLFRKGKWHVRIHKILSSDKTPYVHNHPFTYTSIVLRGGYTEQVLVDGKIEERIHGVGKVIRRSGDVYHRIKSVKPNTVTLFITAKNDKNWDLKPHPSIDIPKSFKKPLKDGIYLRNLNGKRLYCRFKDYWLIGHETLEDAKQETRLSVHQVY